jgi:AraC family transcriptional regulator
MILLSNKEFEMQARIETLNEKKFVGKRLRMSFADNRTGELWRAFMPKRKEIHNNLTNDLFSLQIYDTSYFENFDPTKEFEKWALVEVGSFDNIPGEMEPFVLTGGLYAVFIHQGSSNDNSTFQYIFSTWLPNSDYLLDNRPHFEILGDKYKNADPNSVEEIWIPIKLKK